MWCKTSSILIYIVLIAISGNFCLAACPSADLTGDCFVDYNDFAVMAAQWLTGDPCDPCIPDAMLLIPGGTFEMGDHFNEGFSDERPVHTVTVDSFNMGRYEITYRQYCDYLNSAMARGAITIISGVVYKSASGTSYPYCYTRGAGGYSHIEYSGGVFSVLMKATLDMSNHPMTQVSWFGAVAYCNWRSGEDGYEPCYNLSTWDCDFSKRGYRLPTEAQWEYAARGGLAGKRYPWGDSIDISQANYALTDDPYEPELGHALLLPWTAPVGFYDGQLHQKADFNWPRGQMSYQTISGVNAYGLHDMVGNVREWCNDWHDEGYYAYSPTNNPVGPTAGTYRILRGSSWKDEAYFLRITYRSAEWPTSRYDSCGFRIVLDLN